MKYAWILAVAALGACKPSAPPASEPSPPASDPVEINHAEMALVSLAHNRIGQGNTYFNEKISDADGVTKVCGELTRPSDPNSIVRYSYSLEGTRVYGQNDDAAWTLACANGWEPGTGRYRAS